MPKLCVECKWFRASTYRLFAHIELPDRCGHPDSTTINLIDGSVTYEACLDRRYSARSVCGTLGKQWEAKNET